MVDGDWVAAIGGGPELVPLQGPVDRLTEGGLTGEDEAVPERAVDTDDAVGLDDGFPVGDLLPLVDREDRVGTEGQLRRGDAIRRLGEVGLFLRTAVLLGDLQQRPRPFPPRPPASWWRSRGRPSPGTPRAQLSHRSSEPAYSRLMDVATAQVRSGSR